MDNSSRKNTNVQFLSNITISVVCVMSASRVDSDLHQSVEEHKHPTIGNHVQDDRDHGKDPETVERFSINVKINCLTFEFFLFLNSKQN